MVDNERLRAAVLKLLGRVSIPAEQENNTQYSVGFLAAKSQMLRALTDQTGQPVSVAALPSQTLCDWQWKRGAWHTACGQVIETSRSTKCRCGKNFRIG